MFFAANGARFGVRSTLGVTTGYHITTWVVTAVAGLGFSATIQQFPDGLAVIKILGSFYVLWLAWNLFRAGALGTTQDTKPADFWDGCLLLVLNPKAYIIIALMFSQFLSGAVEEIVRVILITTIFTLNNLVAFTLWTAVGDRLARRFRSEEHARYLNSTFGFILAAVAIWMFLS